MRGLFNEGLIVPSFATVPSPSTMNCSGVTNGLVYVNTSTNTFYYYSNGAWRSGTGGVVSVTATAPLTGGTITTVGSIGLSNSGVTAGSYTLANLTVDVYGRITAVSNGSVSFASLTGKPTTLSGYGITDAINVSRIGVAGGIASLDGTGKGPLAQLPPISITTDSTYIDTSMAQMLNHPGATVPSLSIRTDSSNTIYILAALPSNIRANWLKTQTTVQDLQAVTTAGSSTSIAISVGGLKITTISTGSGSDSILTVVAGVVKKVSFSQFSIPIPTFDDVLTSGNITTNPAIFQNSIGNSVYIDPLVVQITDGSAASYMSPTGFNVNDAAGTSISIGDPAAIGGGSYITVTNGSDEVFIANGSVFIGTTTAKTQVVSTATTNRVVTFPDYNIHVPGMEDTVIGRPLATKAMLSALSINTTGAFIKSTTLTATTVSTFSTTPTTHTIRLRMWGGGGGGGGVRGSASQCAAAGGGGAGSYTEKVVAVSPSTTYTYRCGPFGDGGSGTTPASGGPGTASTFTVSVVYSAPGGSGGEAKISIAGISVTSGGQGGTVASTNGDFTLGGINGEGGVCLSSNLGRSGQGGGQGGGLGVANTSAGGPAIGYGAGGGGAITLSGVASKGGAGSNGLIIVEEYK